MTNEEIINGFEANREYPSYYHESNIDAMLNAARRDEAVRLLEKIRDYERESGTQICYDERTTEQLYEIFKQQDNG